MLGVDPIECDFARVFGFPAARNDDSRRGVSLAMLMVLAVCASERHGERMSESRLSTYFMLGSLQRNAMVKVLCVL